MNLKEQLEIQAMYGVGPEPKHKIEKPRSPLAPAELMSEVPKPRGRPRKDS